MKPKACKINSSILLALFFAISITLPLFSNAEGVAIVCDSAVRLDRSKADIFFIEKINGKRVKQTAFSRSFRDANAAGARLAIGGNSNVLLEGTAKIVLAARTAYSMPILAAGHKSTSLTGEIEFSPISGGLYRVNGSAKATDTAVWIEDAEGRIVSPIMLRDESGQPRIDNSEELRVNYQPKTSNSRIESFLSLTEGTCSEFIHHKLGEPNSVSNEKSWGVSSKVTQIYSGLGSIILRGGVLDQTIPSTTGEGLTPDIVKAAIASASHDTLRRLGADYYRAQIKDQDVLDVLAQTVWQHRRTEDRSVADAMAYFCKTLGASLNSRYHQLLVTVAEQAPHSGLRRHAGAAAGQLRSQSDNVYQGEDDPH